MLEIDYDYLIVLLERWSLDESGPPLSVADRNAIGDLIRILNEWIARNE